MREAERITGCLEFPTFGAREAEQGGRALDDAGPGFSGHFDRIINYAKFAKCLSALLVPRQREARSAFASFEVEQSGDNAGGAIPPAATSP